MLGFRYDDMLKLCRGVFVLGGVSFKLLRREIRDIDSAGMTHYSQFALLTGKLFHFIIQTGI
jgi:hypothetical protein